MTSSGGNIDEFPSQRLVTRSFNFFFDLRLINGWVRQSWGWWFEAPIFHDDVIKWKHFPRYWPFVRGIHRPPVNSPHKGQWRGALMFTLICARINGWVNNGKAGDLRRNRAHYDVIVMSWSQNVSQSQQTTLYGIEKYITMDLPRILITVRCGGDACLIGEFKQYPTQIIEALYAITVTSW